MSGDPKAFLLCHPTLGFDSGDDLGRLGLVHSISRYDARIGRPASPWDDEAFGTRGDVVMGSVSCVRWLPAYMRHTSTVVAHTADAMYSALSGDVDAPLFGPYTVGEEECEQVKTRYAVYVPPPLVGHLLGQELTARQALDRVRGAIIDLGIEVECKPLVDWPHVSLTRQADEGHPVISVAYVIAPVANEILMLHRNALMVRHLTGFDPSIERATKTQIARKIGEVLV